MSRRRCRRRPSMASHRPLRHLRTSSRTVRTRRILAGAAPRVVERRSGADPGPGDRRRRAGRQLHRRRRGGHQRADGRERGERDDERQLSQRRGACRHCGKWMQDQRNVILKVLIGEERSGEGSRGVLASWENDTRSQVISALASPSPRAARSTPRRWRTRSPTPSATTKRRRSPTSWPHGSVTERARRLEPPAPAYCVILSAG